MSNLAITPAALFTTHPLCRRYTIIIATTLYLSNLISYLANYLGPLYLYVAPFISFLLYYFSNCSFKAIKFLLY